MKVLHILDHYLPYHSGYTFRSSSILTHQKDLGVEAVVLTSPRHVYEEGSVEGAPEALRIYRSPLRTSGLRGLMNRVPFLSQAGLMRDLEASLRRTLDAEGEIAVVHAHSPSLNGTPALRVRRTGGPPLVYEVRALWEDAAVDHGTFTEGSMRYRISRYLETRLLRKVDCVVVLCEALRREITARGVAADRVHVVGNGVDTDRFKPRPPDPDLGSALGLGPGPVVGFLGSFYAYEGLALLLEAMAPVLRDLPEVTLLLVGGGPEEAALRQKVRDLGLEGRVVMPGRVAHEAVADHYALVDLLVYPRHSNRLTEFTTPLKPLEAMALGLPVLGSDVGGIRELLEPAGDGAASFPADDADALTRAIRDLLANPQRRKHMGIQGRRYVLAERTWAAQVGKYRAVYDRVLRGCA